MPLARRRTASGGFQHWRRIRSDWPIRFALEDGPPQYEEDYDHGSVTGLVLKNGPKAPPRFGSCPACALAKAYHLPFKTGWTRRCSSSTVTSRPHAYRISRPLQIQCHTRGLILACELGTAPEGIPCEVGHHGTGRSTKTVIFNNPRDW